MTQRAQDWTGRVCDSARARNRRGRVGRMHGRSPRKSVKRPGNMGPSRLRFQTLPAPRQIHAAPPKLYTHVCCCPCRVPPGEKGCTTDARLPEGALQMRSRLTPFADGRSKGWQTSHVARPVAPRPHQAPAQKVATSCPSQAGPADHMHLPSATQYAKRLAASSQHPAPQRIGNMFPGSSAAPS